MFIIKHYEVSPNYKKFLKNTPIKQPDPSVVFKNQDPCRNKSQ